MSWTKARRTLRRAVPWIGGVVVLTALLTPAWILYAPAVADWRWARVVERAGELSFGGPSASTPVRSPWRRDGGVWWSTSFGTAWLEQVWTGPIFHHELTLDFETQPYLTTDGLVEAALVEARRVFPDLHLDVTQGRDAFLRRLNRTP